MAELHCTASPLLASSECRAGLRLDRGAGSWGVTHPRSGLIEGRGDPFGGWGSSNGRLANSPPPFGLLGTFGVGRDKKNKSLILSISFSSVCCFRRRALWRPPFVGVEQYVLSPLGPTNQPVCWCTVGRQRK